MLQRYKTCSILSGSILYNSHSICFLYFFLIIMHQLVKLTDAIWLLQLVISSPLIHALDDPSQDPHRDSNPDPQIERKMTYKLSLPSQVFPILSPFPPNATTCYNLNDWLTLIFDVSQGKTIHFIWLCTIYRNKWLAMIDIVLLVFVKGRECVHTHDYNYTVSLDCHLLTFSFLVGYKYTISWYVLWGTSDYFANADIWLN